MTIQPDGLRPKPAPEPLSPEPISDGDRVAAIARLYELVGSDDLTLEQFAASLDRILAANSQQSLEAAVVVLPSIVQLTPTSRRLAGLVCVDAGIARLELGAGWQLGIDTTVKTNTAKVRLDLTAASWDATEIDLHLHSVTGKVDVIVPRGVAVHIVSMSGRVVVEDLAPPLPGGPILRVDASTKAGRIRLTHGDQQAPRRGRR